ncbi:pilus assembly protein [Pseudomonas sp. NW5]|uniref:pilus assembly protein n=1 Tax=Pseudomonas sp. NW5 TaxID=2934934 RepID=UPI002021E590|nr:pilus assembly protein [Pseudomonas sp. NW5]MCL7462792.1 pilus assembly protein [Pseudomonas sp. NW5]
MASARHPIGGKPHRQRGVALIELLVASSLMTLSIVGLALLQAHARQAELESSQHAHALRLLDDLQQRLLATSSPLSAYLTPTAGLGSGDCPAPGISAASHDLYDWCRRLQGHAVLQQQDNHWQPLAGLNGARGCIERLAEGAYRISIAWQSGLALEAPAVSLSCGLGQYDGPAHCSADRCRRVISRRLPGPT